MAGGGAGSGEASADFVVAGAESAADAGEVLVIHGVFCPRCQNSDLNHLPDGALYCKCGCVFWVKLEEDKERSR